MTYEIESNEYGLGVQQATLPIEHEDIEKTLGTFTNPKQMSDYFRGRQEFEMSGALS